MRIAHNLAAMNADRMLGITKTKNKLLWKNCPADIRLTVRQMMRQGLLSLRKCAD